MNGVHCQASAVMMAMKFQGVWVSQLISTGWPSSWPRR